MKTKERKVKVAKWYNDIDLSLLRGIFNNKVHMNILIKKVKRWRGVLRFGTGVSYICSVKYKGGNICE